MPGYPSPGEYLLVFAIVFFAGVATRSASRSTKNPAEDALPCGTSRVNHSIRKRIVPIYESHSNWGEAPFSGTS